MIEDDEQSETEHTSHYRLLVWKFTLRVTNPRNHPKNGSASEELRGNLLIDKDRQTTSTSIQTSLGFSANDSIIEDDERSETENTSHYRLLVRKFTPRVTNP